MTPLECLVYRYVSHHCWTRRKTVVEVLGAGDWEQSKRVRNVLDLLYSQGTLQRAGTGPRNWTYHVKERI